MMNISFSTVRRLGVGTLLGILLLGAVFSVQSLRRVATEMNRKVDQQEVKERHFTQMALRFSMAGYDFYKFKLKIKRPEELPQLLQHLNMIRSSLVQLQTLPLTPVEQEGVTNLHLQERRLRTTLYVFMESGFDDPAQETAARAVTDIQNIVHDAASRAVHYSYRASEVIEQTNKGIVQSAHRITALLTLGAILACLAGIAVSLLLSRAFKRHLASILSATREVGRGNFAYRIRSPFRDDMGQLASSIDDMAARLEHYEQQQGTILTQLLEAKNISDTQAVELAARATQLEHARESAEAASRSKSQFLANMSHELRTPMNGVLGMTELLLATSLTRQQQHLAERARQSGELLLSIINDILDFSKIEAGKLAIEHLEFDIWHLLEETLELFAERAYGKDLELLGTIQPEVPHLVQGDPLRLRQVLSNLLSNALKFTTEGEIAVHLTLLERTEDSTLLRVSVCDSGIGIPEHLQERIFASFAQADDSTTRQYGGTGLGLAIATQLVEMMGGRIGVESTPGHGSTFWFTTRLQLQLPALLPPAPPTALAGVRVLLVDDNASSRAMMHTQCSAWGMQSQVAASGQQALKLLQACVHQGEPLYDVAVLDAHMPGMPGLELAHALQADPILASVRLILLVTARGEQEIHAARQAGISCLLTKPLRSAHFAHALTAVQAARDGAFLELDLSLQRLTAAQSLLSGRILLAEDNPVNQEVATGMLHELGCQVTVTSTGKEALQALQQGTYDLILMDMQMPEMDGLEATRRIRHDEAQTGRAHLPIIALTANAFTQDNEACYAAGMDGYLSKPYNLEQLHTILRHWLPAPAAGPCSPSAVQSSPGQPDNVALPAVTTEPSPVDTPALDPRPLAELRALQRPGGPDIVQNVLRAYLSSAPQLLSSLHAALLHGDAVATRQSAHSLKSSSGNVGAVTLAAHCHTLEAMGRAQSLAEAGTVLTHIDTEYARVEALLQAALHTD